MHPIEGAQALHQRVEEGATWPRNFECAPQLALRTPLPLSNGRQSQKNRPVAQIRPADHLLNPIQEDRARRFKQHLLVVGVELPHGEAAAGRQPAEGVGEPVGQAGDSRKLSRGLLGPFINLLRRQLWTKESE